MALFSSTEQPSPKTTLTTTLISLLLLVMLSLQGSSAPSPTDFVGSTCLKVSPTEFVDSAREVIAIVEQVASILSRFSSGFGNFRLSNAISDCLDLLDMSSDELTWSASASQAPKGTTHYQYFTAFNLPTLFYSFLCSVKR